MLRPEEWKVSEGTRRVLRDPIPVEGVMGHGCTDELLDTSEPGRKKVKNYYVRSL